MPLAQLLAEVHALHTVLRCVFPMSKRSLTCGLVTQALKYEGVPMGTRRSFFQSMLSNDG